MDILLPIESDDNTLPDDCPMAQWGRLLNDAFAKNASPCTSALVYENELTKIGFVDIGAVREKWPTNCWPRDKKYKQVGKYRPPTLLIRLSY
ncbi:hypothetical protein IMZ48_15490 [Candidatus Bathyarchaeota archaeon]|nr:hypothetical protein [Candidatus Bathyarchaeota archaeon]